MVTIAHPTSGTNPAPTHPECLCPIGLECSWDGHYTGRTNATFSLDQSSVQASQGPTRGAINHKLHETGYPSIHPLKYQNPQQIDFLAQDVCSGPPAELDAPPASFRHLGNQASEGDDQHVAFYPDGNNQVILQDIDTHPMMGGHVLVPETYDGGFGHGMQDHRSYLDTTKTLDSQGSPQSSQAPHYINPRYQHGGYDGMQMGSVLVGSPGSECSASFNGFPSLGNQSWNNGIANMEQEAYDMRLHAEHNFIDLAITADPQNLQDVVPRWSNSTAVCHEPAGEWNPSPQVKLSGERTLPLHRGVGKEQIPDSVIPFIFDVPLQRNSGTTSNAPPPHFLGPAIAFQSKSTRNIHTQQRNRHHVSVSTTKPAQVVGQNISIATDFVDYPVDGRQIQCSSTFPVLRSTGSCSLAGCCGGDHQTSSCSAAIELTNHSMVLGDQWQKKSGPSVPVALSNDATMDQGMINEPLSHHVTSTSIRNRGHLLRSSQESIGIECPWRDEDVCGQWVTSETSAAHLASVHEIKDIPSVRKIQCKACYPPKEIKRESILRHFVEVHIGIKRRPSREREMERKIETRSVPSTQLGAWMSTRTVGG